MCQKQAVRSTMWCLTTFYFPKLLPLQQGWDQQLCCDPMEYYKDWLILKSKWLKGGISSASDVIIELQEFLLGSKVPCVRCRAQHLQREVSSPSRCGSQDWGQITAQGGVMSLGLQWRSWVQNQVSWLPVLSLQHHIRHTDAAVWNLSLHVRCYLNLHWSVIPPGFLYFFWPCQLC